MQGRGGGGSHMLNSTDHERHVINIQVPVKAGFLIRLQNTNVHISQNIWKNLYNDK